MVISGGSSAVTSGHYLTSTGVTPIQQDNKPTNATTTKSKSNAVAPISLEEAF